MIELSPEKDLVGFNPRSPLVVRAQRFLEGASLFLPEYVNHDFEVESKPELGLIVLRNLLKEEVTDDLNKFADQLEYESWQNGHSLSENTPTEDNKIASSYARSASHGWENLPLFKPTVAVNKYVKVKDSAPPHTDARTRFPVILTAGDDEGGIRIHKNLVAGRIGYWLQERDFKKEDSGNVTTVRYGKGDAVIFSGTERLHDGFTDGEDSRLTYLHFFYYTPAFKRF